MSEVAVAETPVDTSQVSTPPSTEAPELVSVPETAAPATQGEETPATEAETTKPLTDWTLEDFDAKVESGESLSAAEIKQRDDLTARKEQSKRDAERNESEYHSKLNTARAQSRTAARTSTARYFADVDNIKAQFDEHGGPPQLLQNLLQQRAVQYERELLTAKELEHKWGHVDAILRLEGDVTGKRREELESQPLDQLAKQLADASFKRGQMSGAPEGFELIKASELEDKLKKARKEGEDAYKAANPSLAPPPANGLAGGGGGVHSLEAWHALSMTERELKRREDPTYEDRVYGLR